MAMRRIKPWWASLTFAVAVTLAACRSSPPVPTSPALLASPTANLTPAGPLPTPSPASPTATPLPTWPDRWEQTGGPPGGWIAAIALGPLDPKALYAAGMGGAVYKSNDGGATWTPGQRLAPASCPFTSLVIDAAAPSTIYAAHTCDGLFKSSDTGSTWSRADAGLEGGITALVQSPHAPGLLLAAGGSGRAYRSRDGATTWEMISDGLPEVTIRSLAASGPDTYWATTANGHDGTLYRFGGGGWSAVTFGQPPDTEPTAVWVDPQDPALIYVGLESLGDLGSVPDNAYLFRSSDGGLNWTPLPDEGEVMQARVSILGQGQRSGLLYIADGAGLLSSPHGGDTWTRLALPGDLLPTDDLRQMAIDPTDNDRLYLPLRGVGIARSEDGGRAWQLINNDLNSTSIPLIAAHPTDPATLYVASSQGEGSFKSGDYGDGWTRLNTADPHRSRPTTLVVDPSHPDTLYQASDTAHIFHSDDGGLTWSAAWPEFRFSALYALAAAPSNPTVLYAYERGSGLFRSDDAGASWRFLSQSGVNHTSALAVHPDSPDFVLSGENQPFEPSAQVHRSKDGGETWDVALEIPDAAGVTLVAFDPRVEPFFPRGKQPDDPTRLYAASVGPRGLLWFSDDAGDSWKPLNDDLGFTNVYALAVAPHRPGVAYAAVWGGGTWRTDDGGQSWHRLSGDPAISAAAIAVDPSNHNVIYVADRTTPHLYRSSDDAQNWELFFDAGPGYDRLAALALAPSDSTILYVSALKGDDPASGAVFRVDANATLDANATDITSNLPGAPASLAVHRRDPRRVFAVVPGAGVWKTVDDGASWRQVKGGLPETDFAQIVVDPILPETLFLTGSDLPLADLNPDEVYGIWKSSDDGNTWGKVGGATFGRASGPVKAIAFHPDDQQVMYAAGDGGIYLSPDRGETWTSINGRLPFTPMNAVATDGQTLYAGSAGAGVFPGPIHPLIHTADWARHSALAAPIHHIQIALHPADPLTLYASAYPGGVFKTGDGGATWRECNSGLPSFAVADPTRQGYYALAIAPSEAEVLYLGTHGHGVYRSDDGAATWRPLYGEEGELQAANVQALLVHPEDPDVVYAATDNGVWHTVNGGRSWGAFSGGLPGSGDVRVLAWGAEEQLYAGTRGYGLYSRDASHLVEDDVWRQLPALGDVGMPQRTALLIHPDDSNTLFAGTSKAGLYKTTDGGLAWREQDVGLGNEGVLVLVAHPGEGQVLYAGTTDGIARSVDGGATWHPWDAGWPPQQWVVSIAFDPSNPDVLYACSQNGLVMKSSDGGATWFEITTGLDQEQAFFEVLVDRFDPQVLYLATAQDGVYVSRDAGATWSSWNEGLWNRVAGGDGNNPANVLAFSGDGRLLYFGTAGSGVWRRPAAGAP